MKQLILCIVLMIFSCGVMAGKWHSEKLEMVYPLANGDFVIKYKVQSPDCANNSGYHYVSIGSNNMTVEGSNKMYSLALVAAASDKELKIYFDETASNCFVNRMHVVY